MFKVGILTFDNYVFGSTLFTYVKFHSGYENSSFNTFFDIHLQPLGFKIN